MYYSSTGSHSPESYTSKSSNIVNNVAFHQLAQLVTEYLEVFIFPLLQVGGLLLRRLFKIQIKRISEEKVTTFWANVQNFNISKWKRLSLSV